MRGGVVLSDQIASNVVPTVGRDFWHTQSYGTSPASNGLNYIALSNDALTETTASTTLSTEIVANGLDRAIGAVSHTVGTAVTTVYKLFTATGAQDAQKAALFTAVAAGTMNHALAFDVPLSLAIADTLSVTFTITLG